MDYTIKENVVTIICTSCGIKYKFMISGKISENELVQWAKNSGIQEVDGKEICKKCLQNKTNVV